MTDFIRRLVSLDKARYKDDELDIDLDLVYITEQVIVMGYPASGLEALYRNRREDAKRFLEHRHGKNFWVFNFCPVAENCYPASIFDGRVSRYPFPDHHAPPLAILPLVAREIRAWLEPSKERVAVLHCKAGKGRSGTMACAYLLTSDQAPSPQTVKRSQTAKDEATARAQQIMNSMPSDDNSQDVPPQTEPGTPVPPDMTDDEGMNAMQQQGSQGDHAENLTRVLELHTSKRMRRPTSPSQQTKQGVSIPSQRRWLYYWSLVISHQAPPGFWSKESGVLKRPPPKIRLTQVAIRMRELSGVKVNLMRAANALLERTSYAKAPKGEIATASRAGGRIWVSLARYDDDLTETLERWERQTRDDGGNMGRRKPGSERVGDEALSGVFEDDIWDKGKMVRPFARLGVVREEDYRKEDTQTDGKVVTRVLKPLTDDKWGKLKETIRQHAEKEVQEQDEKALSDGVTDVHVESESTSISDVTQTLKDDQGVVLNADREVRVKVYMGQVFLGWFWFIPTFHMPHPRTPIGQSSTLVLTRKELDFPVGIGANIIDVTVSMDWVPEKADVLDPPSREGSLASRQGRGEPAVLASSLLAASDPIAGVVDTKQAAED
ncbi:phosphatases II [Fomitopsis serialis]|uniref:phosphatases II n=1 Tax=Fomitopsis serialis TaxID=139415 RepID=UPI0020074CB1|nr:phosphatases II [Neoantrodia serialis]KAH9926719.1 phosphatases II [Neoantrodia serialis]